MTYYDYGSLLVHLRTMRTRDRNSWSWKEHGKGLRAWVQAAMRAHAPIRGRHAYSLYRAACQSDLDKFGKRFWIDEARDMRLRGTWRKLP